MKKEVMFIFLICILFLQFVSADTTFFEGDLGYRDDFIMAPASEVGTTGVCGDLSCNSGESCEICSQDCGVCVETVGGGGLNKKPICNVVFNSLKGHIKKYANIDYDESELETLTFELKEELNVRLLDNQIEALVENFDDECGRPYPLLSGSAIGRFRNLFRPFVIGASVFVLAFFISLYFILKRFKKIKSKKRIKRRRKK